MSYDPLPAARRLLETRQQHQEIAPLPAAVAPATDEQGAAVQHALAELVGAGSPAGFKIGATGQRMQAYLGIREPVAGFMQADNIYHGHAERPFAAFIRPGVECEVVVRLAQDLPAGPCSLAQASQAVGALFAGIELVENRYTAAAQSHAPTLVADQMYHSAAVIGDAHDVDWRSLDLAELRGRISVDQGVADEGVASDLMGHPLHALMWLAGSSVTACFGGLKAGQVIMLGSVTPPIWLDGPAEVTVAFPPMPPVTLRLS